MPFREISQLQLAGLQWRKRHPRAKRLPRPLAPRHPVGIEREYQRDLRRYNQVLQNAVRAWVLPRLPSLVAHHAANRPNQRQDDASDVEDVFSQIELAVSQSYSTYELERLAKRRGVEVAAFNQETIAKNLQRVIGISPIFGDASLASELALFTSANVNLIESMTSDALAKMKTIMYSAFQQGDRAETLAKEIERYVDPSVGNVAARARLIARDQISKLNGQLTELRQTSLGISRYTWRTMGDDRVRDSHMDLADQIFSWDAPPDVGNPGEDFQCRCYADPVLEDVVPGISVEEEAD